MPTNSLIWETPEVLEDDTVLHRFGVPGGRLDPTALAEIMFPKTTANTRGVAFSGSMPNWLAARLAYLALIEEEYLWADLDTARTGFVRLHRLHQLPDSPSPSPLAFATSERERYIVQWFNIESVADGKSGTLDPTQLGQVRLPDIEATDHGVVFVGNGPIWLFAHLALLACEHYKWCGVVNLHNPGARATVVWSRDPAKPIGAYVPDLTEGEDRAIHVGPFGAPALANELRQLAVAIVGAANSGKSMFSYGLSECSRVEPAVWMLRANPDGAGNWYNEATKEIRDSHRAKTKRSWDLTFAERMATIVRDVRRRSNVLFVDLAGLCSDELRLILKECSHAVLLRRADGTGGGECRRFIAACEDDGIELVADLTSQMDAAASAVDIDPATGRLTGIVAGLERGNRFVGDQCEPAYRTLMQQVMDC